MYTQCAYSIHVYTACCTARDYHYQNCHYHYIVVVVEVVPYHNSYYYHIIYTRILLYSNPICTNVDTRILSYIAVYDCILYANVIIISNTSVLRGSPPPSPRAEQTLYNNNNTNNITI